MIGATATRTAGGGSATVLTATVNVVVGPNDDNWNDNDKFNIDPATVLVEMMMPNMHDYIHQEERNNVSRKRRRRRRMRLTMQQMNHSTLILPVVAPTTTKLLLQQLLLLLLLLLLFLLTIHISYNHDNNLMRYHYVTSWSLVSPPSFRRGSNYNNNYDYYYPHRRRNTQSQSFIIQQLQLQHHYATHLYPTTIRCSSTIKNDNNDNDDNNNNDDETNAKNLRTTAIPSKMTNNNIKSPPPQQQRPNDKNNSTKRTGNISKAYNNNNNSNVKTTTKRSNVQSTKDSNTGTRTTPPTKSLLPLQQQPMAVQSKGGKHPKNQQRIEPSLKQNGRVESSRPTQKSSSSVASRPTLTNGGKTAKASTNSSSSKNSQQQQQQQQQQPKFGGNGFGKDRREGAVTSTSTSTPTTTKKNNNNKREFTSLLPPYSIPVASLASNTNDGVDGDRSDDNETADDDDDDFVTNGLSSWEQFLGRGKSPSLEQQNPFQNKDNNNYNNTPQQSVNTDRKILESLLSSVPPFIPQQQQRLPSIQDLFPPDLTTLLLTDSATQVPSNEENAVSLPTSSSDTAYDTTTTNRRGGSNFLDGVLPVSDLFYRSSQQSQQQFGVGDEHDDEELPFSAEQSDAITSDENKVRVRQNMAQPPIPPPPPPLPKNITFSSEKEKSISKEMSRKMIRRGMEMLVGGIPIQADPPQRSVQITYNQPPKDGAGYDWASTISLNTREFGPLLHTESIAKVPDYERGLFCEFFCHAAIKWDVCAKDLRQIVNTHRSSTTIKLSQESETYDIVGIKNDNNATDIQQSERVLSPIDKRLDDKVIDEQTIDQQWFNNSGSDHLLSTNGEIRFEIGVTRDELETGSEESGGSDIFQSVFVKAFHSILERAITASESKNLWDNVVVHVPKLTLQETDDGYTSVCAEFRIDANITSSDSDRELRSSKIGSAFSRSMDDGGFALAIAAAAKEEMRWPETVRNRVVEECLFQDDDGDESTEKIHWTRTESPVMYDREVGLVIPARIGDGRSSLYKGGGTDGVFYDFSAMNALNAPYSGEIGLRMVDAVTERTKQRQPKVIAIGDVHGCIDELQDLLRQCDFRPGDLVVFLGDLVCKGPDSIAVVQMAREIGAIGVRGNHDFEVVRWHQAIKSGVDPPVFGSEHYHIAACLSKADMNWMHSLPWYISSKDLGALFVHAGFVSGIRLAKQNPRLMMNMRSILPDGTVTSKFFNNWPWARLWDGPQTVLFGHDADRGLQQYEHAIGLDTGCVYGGRLTACILPEKKLVSVSAKREYFKYRRKHYD